MNDIIFLATTSYGKTYKCFVLPQLLTGMTDTNDLRLHGKMQKYNRLCREIKKHNLNCHKRQKAMLQLQEMIFNGR